MGLAALLAQGRDESGSEGLVLPASFLDLMTERGVDFVSGGLRHPFGCRLARGCGGCGVAGAVDLGPQLGVAVEQ